MDQTPASLEGTIAALEAQRPLLGDAVIDSAIGPLRDQLAALRSQQNGSAQRLKTVSVLFLDVVGSTAMAGDLDPEDVHAILDGALQRLTSVVTTHGGKVLQYAGDSILAAFGADVVREDDAERAVRCGLALLDEAKTIAASEATAHGVPDFNVRVGIHTGPVLLGGGVDEEGSIRGVAVNV
ncbi:MAG TPA: adenylate/guanylate cyclase domain-containing protein, partial [Casimicrobiaceae bacterium]|nr:adenylate/guanylate cyclase domain-containing protein [Casimicrobiaceae bacterium]